MTVLRTVAATPGQRLLWMMEHYRGADSPLNVPTFYRLRGPLDRPALGAAIDALVARHEALRTTYVANRSGVLLHVHEPAPVPVRHEVVGPDPAALAAAMVRAARERFDLSETVFHPTLLEVSDTDHVLVLSIHHLSTDGWSGGVLSGELGRLYRPGGQPADAELPPVAWQYADFAEWQLKRFESDGVLAQGQQFWRSLLKGAHLPALPGTGTSRSGTGQIPGILAFELAEEVVSQLATFCRANRITTYIAGLALFGAVLHLQTGDDDLAFASMFANRSRPELIGTVGFLANLMVLRLAVQPRPSFRDLVAAARDVLLDALAYQEVPYHLVPRARDERPTDLENILFQVAAGPAYGLEFEGMEVSQLNAPDGIASRFDLEFVLMPEGQRIKGLMWFDQRRFDPEWARRFVADYQLLASAAIAAPDRPLAELRPESAG